MACDSDPVYEVEDEINPPVPPVEVHLTKDDAFMRFRYVQQDICAVVKEEPRDTPPLVEDDYVPSPPAFPGFLEDEEVSFPDMQEAHLSGDRATNGDASETPNEPEAQNDSARTQSRSATREHDIGVSDSIFERGFTPPQSPRSREFSRSEAPALPATPKQNRARNASTQTPALKVPGKRQGPNSRPKTKAATQPGTPVQGKFLPEPKQKPLVEQLQEIDNVVKRNAINAFLKARGSAVNEGTESCSYSFFWSFMVDMDKTLGSPEQFNKFWFYRAPSVKDYMDMSRLYHTTYFPDEDYNDQMDYVVRKEDRNAKCIFASKREWKDHLVSRTEMKSTILRCRYWDPVDPENSCLKKFQVIDSKMLHEKVCQFQPYKVNGKIMSLASSSSEPGPSDSSSTTQRKRRRTEETVLETPVPPRRVRVTRGEVRTSSSNTHD